MEVFASSKPRFFFYYLHNLTYNLLHLYIYSLLLFYAYSHGWTLNKIKMNRVPKYFEYLIYKYF